MNKIYTLVLLLSFAGKSIAQETDFRYHLNYQNKSQIFFNFENDFFLATDRYYSQGIALGYKRPVKKPDLWLNKLYLGKQGDHSITFGFDQMAFTPTTIAFDSVLREDRPYAATMRANVFFETIDSARNSAISWGISAGIIGPAAQGKELQTGIHRATENPIPKGWQYQINTGLLLDFNVFAQQQLLAFGKWFILVAEESAWAGTSRIQATAGARLQVQFLSDNRKYSFGTYANPAVTVVGYDGTLQGSLIAKKSEYVVGSDHVKNVLFEREFGAFIRAKNFEYSATVNIFTNTFHGAGLQRWGGMRVKVYF